MRCTANFSCVRIFRGSVWFVRAIGKRQNLWHGQTIRFRRNGKTSEIRCTVDFSSVRTFRRKRMICACYTCVRTFRRKRMVCACHRFGPFAMAWTNHTLLWNIRTQLKFTEYVAMRRMSYCTTNSAIRAPIPL